MLLSNYSDENQILFRYIVGAFYKQQRINNNLSLGKASKLLHMNKGFLSDLEHGNRHFPNGIISQFNDFYSCNFNESISLRIEAEKQLTSAFTYLFQKQTEEEFEILEKAFSLKDSNQNSYAFFIYQILELFYHLRVSCDEKAFKKCKLFIDNYLYALSTYEKSIYYSLLAIYYRKDNFTSKIAYEYISLSNSLCSKDSVIFAMNLFQLIIILCEMNKSALALLQCQKAKIILKDFNNYKRLSDVDLLEGNCLILLNEQEEAQSRLKSILELGNNNLSSSTNYILQSLAFSFIMNHQYQECINTIQPIMNELSKDVQWYLPFCLYQLKRFDECNDSIKIALLNCNKINSHFLLAIQSLISNNHIKFIEECMIYYHLILQQLNYDDVPILLNFMSDIEKERKNDLLQLEILKDLNLYHEKELTIESSGLLNNDFSTYNI